MKEYPRPLRLLCMLWLLALCALIARSHAAQTPEAGSNPFTCQTATPPASELLQSWAQRRAAPASAWTEGRKRLLLVRVDFSDLVTVPFTPAQGTNLLVDMDRFYSEMSYGKIGFHPPGGGSDYTPVLRMPRTAAVYGVLDPSQLRTDALTAARNAGYNALNYDLDVICTANVTGYNFTGLAYVGIRGAWVKNSFGNAGAMAHEIGHNLGLNHANLWNTSGLGVIGSGKEVEYGDSSDTMSLSTGYSRHFNARSKHLLNWLADSEVAFPTSSGIHRIYAHDVTNAAAGPRAVRITRDSRTNFWFEFRDRHTNAPIASSSLGIRWADNTNRATLFLDTTPNSVPGVRDGFLRPGRTFSDPLLQLHVTTLARTNTTPPALDVDFQFGPFPNNHPPVASLDVGDTNIAPGTTITFQVTASDPNGDALAYGWDIGDESIPDNAPSFTRTFSTVGEFIVQCVVSDRRGGTATVKSIVRVGEPSGWRVSGTIRRDDEPFEGASIITATTRIARSDSAGNFTFVGLTNGPQTLRPFLDGHAFVPARTNITVADADLTGIDFDAYAYEDLESVDLSPVGSSWRYLDNGTDPGVNWKNNSFSDTAWKLGNAPLGYGMNDLATTVSYGPNAAGKWVTTYFRRAFNTPVLAEWLALRIHLQRDDGAIVYLNGTEIARSNMKEGTFTFLTFSTEETTGDEERAFFTFNIDPSILRADRNVIAVEVHQSAVNTPDCRFDLRVEGLRVPVITPPTFSQLPAPQTVNVGQPASFSALATGSAPIAYQWLRNDTILAGKTNTSLSFATTTTNDAAAYRVIASNAGGSITSAPVTLTVLVPPTFVTAPTNLTVVLGQPALFTSLASGSQPLTYQWLRNDAVFPGKTDAALAFAATTTNDIASYRVIASNAAGSVTSAPVSLTILTPPSFVTTPISQTVIAGQPAAFSALASGAPTPVYAWFRNGSPIDGASLPTLSFAAASTNDAATYLIVASNSAGSITSAPVTLTVLVPPTFVTTPTNLTVVLGQPALFTSLASGSQPLTYQWLRNDAVFSGKTDATLTFATTTTNDMASYRVIASNAAGSVTSAPVSLTILTPPAFVTTPTSQTVTAGQPAAFSALASGAPTPGYAWFRNGSPIDGASLPTLSFAAASTNDAATYLVVASNSAGSITSAPVTLTVLVPPTLVTTPTNLTVVLGQPALFTSLASGSQPLTYQWLRNDAVFPGKTDATLTFATTTTNDMASYRVIASNAAGSVTSAPVSLTILTPPAFVTTPTSQTVIAGQPAAFSALASGAPTPAYAWFRNGSPIDGASLPTLSFAAASTNDAATYLVVASNSAGSITSAPVTLTVLVPPTFVTAPTNLTVVLGQPALFTSLATGSQPLTYQWLRNDAVFSGKTDASLAFATTTTNDIASYRVIASNAAGSVTSAPVSLTILTPPAFVTTPTSQTVIAGQPAAFSALASGAPTPVYAWFRNGSPIDGASLPTLSFAAASTNDAATYLIVASNSAGSITSAPVTLTVLVPPTFVTTPTNLTVVLGQPALFTSLASGSQPLTYQWLRNDAVFPGMTDATLTFATTTTNDIASYRVIASNAAGSVTSAPVSLTILTPPAFVTTPISQTVIAGQPAAFSALASGAPTPGYAWFRNGSPIDGASLPTLSFAAASTNDAAAYLVVASNSAGSITSAPVTLTVLVAPTFVTTPTNLTVVLGQPALFTSLASGSQPLTYQWLRNDAVFSGKTDATLTFATTTTNDMASYRVIASNAAGSVTSAPVSLTILTPPSFVTTPISQTVIAGQPAAFIAEASGAPTPGYAWFRNGSPIDGASLPTLSFAAASTNDAATYLVVASNSAGSITSAPVTLTVLVPPTFVTAPTNLTVVLGQPALFTSLASGSQPLTYQWLRNDAVFPGKTDAALTFATTTTNDIASYRVIASNAAGSVTSAPVSLTILTPPAFVTTPTSQTVIAGQPAAFSALASGAPTPVYAWFRNGSPIDGASLPTLSFAAASTNDIATYLVVASNSAGSITSAPVTLTILTPPAFVTTPTSQTVIAGQPAAFSALASGAPTPVYAWFRNGSPIDGASLPTLSFAAASTNDAATYLVVASNSAGSITSAPVTLTVLVPPSITAHPNGITRKAGESAVFEVAAVGSATLQFQWLKDAVEIPGANLARFEIPAVSSTDAGSYTVRVSNPAGSVVSGPALLTVGVAGSAATLVFGSEADPTIRIEGTPGARYRIEGSSGLDVWTTESEVVIAPSGFVNWPVPLPLTEVRLFRVVSVP